MSDSSSTDGPDDPVLWFGFIEPKASWSSVLALILSLAAAVYQSYWFFIGPDIRFIQPQQVMLNIADGGLEKGRVRVIVPLSFINHAPSGYSGVVVNVRARLSGDLADGAFSVDLGWTNFVRTNPLADKNAGEKGLETLGGVVPQMIKGASAISRDTEFLAIEMPKCVTGACTALRDRMLTDPKNRSQKRPLEFVWSILQAAAAHRSDLVLELWAITERQDRIDVTCTIETDASFAKQIRTSTAGGEERSPYHAPPCREAVEN